MAGDMFIKIEGGGIVGESSDSKHKEWIEISSFSRGVTQAAGGQRSTSGAPAGARADFSDVTITKELDKASPKLMIACAQATALSKVTIEFCRAVGEKGKYMEYILEDAIISSVSTSGGGGGLPQESISFNYGKITEKYYLTDQKSGKLGGVGAECNWSTVENAGA